MKNLVFLVSALLVFVGCADLDEDPVGVINPETFFQDADNLESAVNGAYGLIASEEFWGRKFTLSLMLRGDMVTTGDPGTSGRRKEVDRFTMRADNGMVAAFWPMAFNSITAANNAILNVSNVEADQGVKDRLEGEARFIKAFTYYHLVRTIGEVPFVETLPTTPDELLLLEKSSVNDIYQRIIEDLTKAKDLLPNEGGIRTRPSRGTAAAYLASVYLTRGEWQKAYDEAKFVIDNNASFNYSLVADFQDLFNAEKAENSSEHIFAIDFTGADDISGTDIGLDFLAPLTGPRGPAVTGWSVAVPTLAVFNSFDNNDYRKQVSFITEAVINGETVGWEMFSTTQGVQRPHIAKYFRFPGLAGANNRDSSHNYIAMRYAEVLLIAAEASNELFGPTAEAEGYINEIRSRARNAAGIQNSSPEDINISGQNADTFRDIIIEERRIELAFEYKRWYDIKRLDIGAEVFGSTGYETDVAEQQPFDPSRDYLFPIPSLDLETTPSLLPQNPGY